MSWEKNGIVGPAVSKVYAMPTMAFLQEMIEEDGRLNINGLTRMNLSATDEIL